MLRLSQSPTDPAFDLDLYLEGGVYFELYGVTCYADLDGAPLADRDHVLPREPATLVVLADIDLVVVLGVGRED